MGRVGRHPGLQSPRDVPNDWLANHRDSRATRLLCWKLRSTHHTEQLPLYSMGTIGAVAERRWNACGGGCYRRQGVRDRRGWLTSPRCVSYGRLAHRPSRSEVLPMRTERLLVSRDHPRAARCTGARAGSRRVGRGEFPDGTSGHPRASARWPGRTRHCSAPAVSQRRIPRRTTRTLVPGAAVRRPARRASWEEPPKTPGFRRERVAVITWLVVAALAITGAALRYQGTETVSRWWAPRRRC